MYSLTFLILAACIGFNVGVIVCFMVMSITEKANALTINHPNPMIRDFARLALQHYYRQITGSELNAEIKRFLVK